MKNDQSTYKNQIEKGSTTHTTGNKILNKYKKQAVFTLMGVVFLGVLYLIFKPIEDELIINNDLVPEAITSALPSDKVKAYEQELWEQKKEQDDKQARSLADYWDENEDSNQTIENSNYSQESSVYKPYHSAYQNYRQNQEQINSFYQNRDTKETEELKKQIEDLKLELSDKDTQVPITIDNQLELMEKSFQMAAKYLPNNTFPNQTEMPDIENSKILSSKKQTITKVQSTNKNVVSSLSRPTVIKHYVADSEMIQSTFYTPEGRTNKQIGDNSIRVAIKEDQIIINEGFIKLKLLESITVNGLLLPKSSTLIAKVRVASGRLDFHVSSIKIAQSIIETNLVGYDNYGQHGLEVLDLQEINATKEIIANMGQTAGTSISMTKTASDQIAADLSKGLIGGVSGYFSKKVKAQRVTLKQGQELFLMPKE
ncbi:conjugative transposon protein TraM [Flavobacterium sp. HSC-61S13]|uniref:conjugative transposon protein TraM n=1 Tax=Flavobacterium sp. HSC-61S13 TaxID=2910963 RepID=UPI00209F9973|nr:conjugative transposon protein TraM [Flavobacterium sp. HSC-61S13]MCP1994402.1 conjugative transposon TraM protein [Flavobacterium sp. HSC-61S13]